MDNLVKYNKDDHEYIINGGIMMYEYNKKFGKMSKNLDEFKKDMENSKDLLIEKEKNSKLGEKIMQIERENDDCKEKILKIEKKNMEIRETFLNKEMDIKTNLYNAFEKKIRSKY